MDIHFLIRLDMARLCESPSMVKSTSIEWIFFPILFLFRVRFKHLSSDNHWPFPLVSSDNVFSVNPPMFLLSSSTDHLAIMRFMGDYPLARSQTLIDCVVYLLKVGSMNLIERIWYRWNRIYENIGNWLMKCFVKWSNR